jgi:hypothetical protein
MNKDIEKIFQLQIMLLYSKCTRFLQRNKIAVMVIILSSNKGQKGLLIESKASKKKKAIMYKQVIK